VKKENLLILYLFFLILSPPITIFTGFSALRLEWIIVIYAALTLNNIFKVNIGIMIAFLIASVSILSSKYIFGFQLVYSDFMIFFNIIMAALTLAFFIQIVSSERTSKIRVLLFFLLFMNISAGFGIFQSVNIGDINTWLTTYYVDRDIFNKFEIGMDYSSLDRVVGTFGDSRHFGFVLSCSIVINYVLMKFVTVWRYRMLLKCSFVILVWCLILTGSRTALLSSVATLLMVEEVYSHFRWNLFRVFFVILVGSYFLLSENLELRSLDFESKSASVSANARKRDNIEFFKRVDKSPAIIFFGLGPAKSVLPGHEHSEMAWFLIRFGITGLMFYLIFIGSILKRIITNLNSKVTKLNHVYSLMSLGCILSYFFFFFSESLFKLPQIFGVFLFSVSLCNYKNELTNKISIT
jgi:hypothetical protein